jgi:hypothetical protein
MAQSEGGDRAGDDDDDGDEETGVASGLRGAGAKAVEMGVRKML